MSRCFPFPPPGYEKRTRIDDTDLLIKEKYKEKKHKDKKHKEKKEGKEKRDKEERNERHREKKEQQQKKKDKQEEGRGDKKWGSNEKKDEELPDCYNGWKLGKNSQQNVEARDSKLVQGLSRRNGDEGRATGSHVVKNIILGDQKRAEILQRVVGHNIGHWSGEKERNYEKEVDQKINGQEIQFEVQGLEKAVNYTLSVMDQRRLDGSTMSINENYVGKEIDGKRKKEFQENEIKGNNSKDRNFENKIKEKYEDRDKEKEKVKKLRGNFEAGNGKPKVGSKNSLGTCTIKASDISKVGVSSSTGDGNLGKRKELEKNGYNHENGIRSNKLPRSVSSFCIVVENGRKPESCQTAMQFGSEKSLAVNNHKLGIKDKSVNGFLEPQQPNISLRRPLSANVHVNVNGEVSREPTHPDSKYLSQIYTVPHVDDLALVDYDDREWLFCSNNLQAEKTKIRQAVDGSQEVWAEAIQIEKAEIVAFPYVTPY